jgi:hypothetical protein
MTADEALGAPLRNMQIIAGSLMAGVVMFLGVVTVLVFGQGQPANPNQQLPIVTIVAFVMLAADFAVALVMSRTMTSAGQQQIASNDAQSDLQRLVGLRQTVMVITFALLEGPAFVGCVALLIERQPYVIFVPIFALTVMAVLFPTRNSVRNWLETQAQRVLELRLSRSSTKGQ